MNKRCGNCRYLTVDHKEQEDHCEGCTAIPTFNGDKYQKWAHDGKNKKIKVYYYYKVLSRFEFGTKEFDTWEEAGDFWYEERKDSAFCYGRHILLGMERIK